MRNGKVNPDRNHCKSKLSIIKKFLRKTYSELYSFNIFDISLEHFEKRKDESKLNSKFLLIYS